MFSTALEDVVIQKLNDELAPFITKTLEASIGFVTPEDCGKLKKQIEIT